jgi:3-methyl-2-oxobutanoate hydroxymethyltransferase
VLGTGVADHVEMSEVTGTTHGQRPAANRRTAPSIAALKGERRIVALTAYDFPTARLLDEADFDIALVGDSASNVVLGNDSTLPITLDEMLMFGRAVVRGCRNALVVGDLPFGSYHESDDQAVRSALRFVKEAGVGAVKLEGGRERAAAVRRIVDCGVPVMGHIGLRPQSALAMGGYKVQGRGDAAAQALRDDAAALADAGAFSIVVEGVPSEVAARLTKSLTIPTIGIGAGPDCDGQILVFHDLVGLSFTKPAKFVRRYADLATSIRESFARFRTDVLAGDYPGESESYR